MLTCRIPKPYRKQRFDSTSIIQDDQILYPKSHFELPISNDPTIQDNPKQKIKEIKDSKNDFKIQKNPKDNFINEISNSKSPLNKSTDENFKNGQKYLNIPINQDIIYDKKPEYHVRWEEKVNKSTKNILFFTPYFHMKDFQFGFGHLPFLEKGCPVTNCFTTNNKTMLSK